MNPLSRSEADTIYSADSIEFCPLDSNLFACGTYQIIKDDTEAARRVDVDGDELEALSPSVERFGRCLLYQVDDHGRHLRELQRFEGPAILDMKWSPKLWNGSSTLAIADAKGQVQLHRFDESSKRLAPWQSINCAKEETLCLSLDWSNRLSTNISAPSIVVSMSDGNVCTLKGESELKVSQTWHAHDFEPWIAAFDCWTPTTVWTGGDDCKLKGWDLRQGCETPTFVNKRFEGGVTTIQSHPLLENVFAVGSYDATVRIFDRRNPLLPLLTHDAGGGIWRLKWHATEPSRLLMAAMHNGFKVVDFVGLQGEGEKSSREHASFQEHGKDALAYGVDWSGRRNANGEDVVASCSFYDHLLHVWAC